MTKIRCSSVVEVTSCGKTCGKLLGCKLHRCQKTCHDGPCAECDQTEEQSCNPPSSTHTLRAHRLQSVPLLYSFSIHDSSLTVLRARLFEFEVCWTRPGRSRSFVCRIAIAALVLSRSARHVLIHCRIGPDLWLGANTSDRAGYCGKVTTDRPCGSGTSEGGVVRKFTCARPCSKVLGCGHHFCKDECHPGRCQPCGLEPEIAISCPCTKKLQVQLGNTRTSCTATST